MMLSHMYSTMQVRIIPYFEALSIQKRLIISYFCIILLPSMFISFFIFNELRMNTIDDVRKKSESTLNIEMININNNIETMVRSAQLSISERQVLNYLELTADPSVPELIDINSSAFSNIQRLQYNNPNIEHIRLFMSNEKGNEIWPVFLQEKRVQQEAWYKEVTERNGLEMWQVLETDNDPVQINGSNKKNLVPKIALLREIEYPRGVHVGIVEVDMLLHHFFSNTFQTSGIDQSQMFVADQGGRLFYNQSSPFLQLTGLSESDIRTVLKKSISNHNQSIQFTSHGMHYLAVSQYIDRLNMHVVNVTSLESVFTHINKTRDRIVIANIALMLVLSLVTFLFTSLILKKLHILTDSIKKVRQGDFSFEINVHGAGEVGELAHHFRKMLQKINELIAEGVTKKAASREAELRSLQNQIDSHFLYNTLENIKMLAEVEQQHMISDALTSLGGMIRYNLKWTTEHVSLQDELNHIHNYISIMNLRFEHPIQLEVNIDPEYFHQNVLKMSLQPIVENSVKHGMNGVWKQGQHFVITISAEVTDGVMVITVIDNGVGMTAERTKLLNENIQEGGRAEASLIQHQSGNGIGLRNVHQRIQLYYGPDYGLHVVSVEGNYTCVVIKIPYFTVNGGLS